MRILVLTYIITRTFSCASCKSYNKRTHEKKRAREICFVDSSESCDQSATIMLLIISGSVVGGMPLACLFHKAQTKDN